MEQSPSPDKNSVDVIKIQREKFRISHVNATEGPQHFVCGLYKWMA